MLEVKKRLPASYRKGIGLIFPNPDTEIGPSRHKRGNANELGEVGGGPREEFSFLCKSNYVPWNRLHPEIGTLFP